MKLPPTFVLKVVELPLVKAGAALTVSVNVWVAALPTPFAALMQIVYVPPAITAVVLAIVAVPFPLSVNETAPGSVDFVQPVKEAFVSAGAGKPDVVTVKPPAVPEVKVVPVPLVIAGAVPTVSVYAWVAEPAVLVALRQSV